jgi:hypothetical protein
MIKKEFPSINVFAFEETHKKFYRGLKDLNIVEYDDSTADTPALYAEKILQDHMEIVQPGMRAYIPGSHKKDSHDAVANMLLRRGFAVVVLNGTDKELRLPDGKIIELRDLIMGKNAQELGRILAKMYQDYNLQQYPYAVTGYLCVQRGITFNCDRFAFDYGIVGKIAKKYEAYQTLARLCGNIGHLPEYKPATLFTFSKTITLGKKLEQLAITLPKMLHQRGITTPSDADIRSAIASCDPEKSIPMVFQCSEEEYETFKRGIRWNRPVIFEAICRRDPALATELERADRKADEYAGKEVEFNESNPQNVKSYNIRVNDLITAFETQTPKQCKSDRISFYVNLDMVKKRIIVQKCYSSGRKRSHEAAAEAEEPVAAAEPKVKPKPRPQIKLQIRGASKTVTV